MSIGLLTIVSALSAIALGAALAAKIIKKPSGTEKMRQVASAIAEGARAYLIRQYKTVALIAVPIFLGLGFLVNWPTALSFLVGALLSALAGIIGMNISIRANVRTAAAASEGLAKAFSVAVEGGAITGLLVVGLALLGVAGLYFFNPNIFSPANLIGL